MRRHYLLVILAAAFSLAAFARSPFNHPDEFNYIAGARTMIETGDWITPQYNYSPRVVKPVLFYWIVAGSFKIFGPSIYLARLCSAAAAIAGVALVGFTARHLLGRRYAAMAALIAASQLTIVQFSRFAITDITLWAFCCLAHLAFFHLQFPAADRRDASPPEPKNSWRWAMLFFAATALALLTKGPIALLWCGLPVLWLVIRRDWQGVRRLHLPAGAVVLLAIVAPWTAVFIHRNHALLREMLWNHSSPESYAQFTAPIARPWQFFAIVPLVLLSMLPWLPAIVASMLTGRRDASRADGLLTFWIIAIIVLLGLAHRKDFRYLVPLATPVALFLALPMHRLFNDPSHRRAVGILSILFAMMLLIFAGLMTAAIRHTPVLPVNCLWPAVFVLVAAVAGLGVIVARRSLHPALPAFLLAVLFVEIGVLDWQTEPLTEPRPESLALLVEQSLPANYTLFCYNFPARSLIYLTRQPQIEVRDSDRLQSALERAPAVLIRQRDWQGIPEDLRNRFTPIGQCVGMRTPAKYSLNLADYREPVLLLLRKPPATQP